MDQNEQHEFLAELGRAIGDLGPARRHVYRLRSRELTPTIGVLNEIAGSVDRCVTRLEKLEAAHTAATAETSQDWTQAHLASPR